MTSKSSNLTNIWVNLEEKGQFHVLIRTKKDILGFECPYKERRTKKDAVGPLVIAQGTVNNVSVKELIIRYFN